MDGTKKNAAAAVGGEGKDCCSNLVFTKKNFWLFTDFTYTVNFADFAVSANFADSADFDDSAYLADSADFADFAYFADFADI